jgi:hypothetical protein
VPNFIKSENVANTGRILFAPFSTTAQQYNTTVQQHNTTVQQYESPKARLPTAPLINCRPNIKQREFSGLFILSKTVAHFNTNLPADPHLYIDG